MLYLNAINNVIHEYTINVFITHRIQSKTSLHRSYTSSKVGQMAQIQVRFFLNCFDVMVSKYTRSRASKKTALPWLTHLQMQLPTRTQNATDLLRQH